MLRVLKPGGRLTIVAEAHKRTGKFALPYALTMRAIGAKYLTADEHRRVLAAAGYDDVQLRDQGEWLCATARRPIASA